MAANEYERYALIAYAEIIDLLSELVFPSPNKGTGGKPREIADALRVIARSKRRLRRSS